MERGHDWLGGLGFCFKSKRSCFLGSGKIAKAKIEDCDWCVLGFIDRGFCKCTLKQVGFVTWAEPVVWALHFMGTQISLIISDI